MVIWSRIVLDLMRPPASIILLMLLGLIIMAWTKFRNTGRTLIIVGFIALYLLSTPLISNLLILPLEDDYLPLSKIPPDAGAVVVLSSGAKDLSHVGLGPVPGGGSINRLVHGIKIKGRLKGVPLVMVGGKADPSMPWLSIGAVIGEEALALGVSKGEIIVEERSKNTFEGAMNLKKMLEGKNRVILVTSAFHMGRSVMLFEKVGFEVVPAPTDYIGEGLSLGISSFIPTSGSLEASSVAIYEYLCKLWYILKDAIN